MRHPPHSRFDTSACLGVPLGQSKLRKEGNILFNDALNTFYLRLYGVRHMVKDHSDSERGNPLPPHRLLFPISSKGYFICTIPQDRITHTTAFVTPVPPTHTFWHLPTPLLIKTSKPCNKIICITIIRSYLPYIYF